MPRSGWRRTAEYVGHRIRRIPDTPHKIAIGISCGIIASFSPFFGLHFFYAALLAVLVRGNVIAALLGTFIGNPITFPFIATMSLQTGRWLLGYCADGENAAGLFEAFGIFFTGLWQSIKSLFGMGQAEWDALAEFARLVLWPWFLGGMVPGLLLAVVTYILSRPLIAAYQVRRRARRMKYKAEARKNSP